MRSAFVLAAALGLGLCSPASARWVAKTGSLPEIQRRCRFKIPVPPGVPPGYALKSVAIEWVPAIPDLFPKLPARHAVRLIYRVPKSSLFIDIIETPHAAGVTRIDNIDSIIGQGHFNTSWVVGQFFHLSTVNGIDIYTSGPSLDDDDLCAIWRPNGYL